MKRRNFLKGAAGMVTLIGVASVGVRGSAMAASEPRKADLHHHEIDHTPATVDDDFHHRGRRVQILRRERGFRKRAKIRIAIDGHEKESHVFADVGDRFGSHMLPFEDFRRPQDLAKALIDNDGILYIL